jgi:hypothetical protein
MNARTPEQLEIGACSVESERPRPRHDLPRGGDVIVAWVNPLAWWGARIAAAIATAKPASSWCRGRAHVPMEDCGG